MSLPETFLRGGAPATSTDVFKRGSCARCNAWFWVLVYPRRWHLDRRKNTITAPIYHLLFGQPVPAPSSSREEEAGHADPSSWQLLYIAVQPNSSASTIIDYFKAAWDSLPGGLRSATHSLSFISVLKGCTHEKLNLFCQNQWEHLVARVRDHVAPSAAAPPSHIDFTAALIRDGALLWRTPSPPEGPASVSVVIPKAEARSCLPFMTDSWLHSGSFNELLDQATVWLETRSSLSTQARDASIPCQGNCEPLLDLVLHLNPVLTRTRFVELSNVEKALASNAGSTGASSSTSRTPNLEDLSGIAKLKAQCDLDKRALKHLKGEATSFSIPDVSLNATDSSTLAADDVPKQGMVAAGEANGNDPAGNTQPFRHVLLLQKYPQAKEAGHSDYRDVGPLKPQPIGAEFHLYQDLGDVVYVMEELNNTGLIDFNCDHYLPEEGEVLLQLAPVEGVPFDDLDSLLNAVAAVLHTDSAASNSHTEVLCDGSCSRLIFPRVVYRLPTEQTAKLNPIARSERVIEERSPTTAMVSAAAAILRLLANHVVDLHARYGWRVGVGEGGYTLTGLSPVQLPRSLCQAFRRCASCGRRRERLLRCGGCQVMWYCSRKHQMMDWKEGNHKLECLVWRKNRQDVVRVFKPQLSGDKEGQGGMGVRTPGWSCAMATLAYLCEKSVVDSIAAQLKAASETTAEEGTNASSNTLQPIYIHLIGIEAAWVEDFVLTLNNGHAKNSLASVGFGDLLCCQVRLMVFTNAASPDRKLAVHNCVFAVPSFTIRVEMGKGSHEALQEVNEQRRADNPKLLVEPTHVIGDIWHVEGDESSSTSTSLALARQAAMLIWICDAKYHSHRLVESELKMGVGKIPEEGNKRNDKPDEAHPAAVINFGPSSGEGLNLFSAVLEVCARSKVGLVPVRLLESSLVAAHRTAQALLTRLDVREDKKAASVRNLLKLVLLRTKPQAILSEQEQDFFVANPESVCLPALAISSDQEAHPALVSEGQEEPIVFMNSYYFDIPAF